MATASTVLACGRLGNTSTSLHASVLFVATLSAGEALWSPQFYSYTYEVAPAGQAGQYFAMANVPLFLPKLFAGVLSGGLLEAYVLPLHCAHVGADGRPLRACCGP